jgi:hypothetical protein
MKTPVAPLQEALLALRQALPLLMALAVVVSYLSAVVVVHLPLHVVRGVKTLFRNLNRPTT